MARVTQHSIDELKTRVNIVEEVERHVRLQKAGRSYKGLSPFSQEKTPSFYVDPQKGAFYCFSSTQGGDVIRFVELVEHLPFNEAVEVLAQRYNIELEYESGGGPDRAERSARRELLDIHDRASEYFHQCLMGQGDLAAKVREYWTEKRRFTLDVAKDFHIGFCPPDGDELLRLLLKQGHSPEILTQSGIFSSPEGTTPNPRNMRSRFRGRLTIPIREPSQGQVIAFTARELFCTPGAGTLKLGKYVNSPGTPLFHKSNVLFNLERAQKNVRNDAGGFVMVEGQLDAIRCFTNGLTSTVAPQGTSVTDEQMHILKRHSDHLRIVLDGDAAGQRAALRALPMAFTAGLEPVFVVLPSGSDPDSLILDGGAEAMQTMVEKALPPMEFLARAIHATPEYSGPRGMAEAMKRANEILSVVDSEIARVEYLRELCSLVHVDFDAAQADLMRFILKVSRRAAPTQAEPRFSESGKEEPRLTTLESEIWYYLLQHEELAPAMAERIDDRWIDASSTEGFLLGRLLWELRDGSCSSVSQFVSSLDEEDSRSYVFHTKENIIRPDAGQRWDEYERRFVHNRQDSSDSETDASVTRDADNLLQRLFIRYRKRRIEEINAEMSAGGDPARMRQLLEERKNLMDTTKQLPCLSLRAC